MSGDRDNPRTKVVTFRLTPAEREDLDAKRGSTTIADFIRNLIFGRP